MRQLEIGFREKILKIMKLLLNFCVLILGFGISSSNAYDDEPIDLSHYGNALYSNPDYNYGRRLSSNEYTGNPEEVGTYLEGDLRIPMDHQRSGLKKESFRWRNGIIPFEIRGQYSDSERRTILEAFNLYHQNTCIKFVPRRSEVDFISIENDASGCWSSIGRIGKKQAVNLQNPNCVQKIGTVIHELMHAVGFMHEQNREDRDGYVIIRSENIKQGFENNFNKAPSGSTINFADYDYGSVMHYATTSFSRNNKPTIVAKRQNHDAMGQRDGFSSKDIEKINRMYKCKSTSAADGHYLHSIEEQPPNGIFEFFNGLFPQWEGEMVRK